MYKAKTLNSRTLALFSLSFLSVWLFLPEPLAHAFTGLQGSAETPIDFVKEIQPILKASCIRCHGPAMQMGHLRLDAKSLAFQGGISGKAIIPGKSGDSLLFQRIQASGDKVRMPLQGDPLSKDQIALIRAWIDQGAPWSEEGTTLEAKIDRHWA